MLGEWTDGFITQREGPNGYHFPEIDPTRWCQVWPYQLLIVRMHKGPPKWLSSFTLPIPPQSLDLDMPIAELATATIGGIAEDHSGAPFRTINLSGTTGIAPFRRSTAAAPSPILTHATSIAGGTVQAARGLVEATGNLLEINRRPHLHKGLSADSKDPDHIPERSTGYYQFHLLQRFLENYLAIKQKEHGRDHRLVFAIWKDNAAYLVTPQRFTLRRSAQRPREYTYQLTLRAWRRIDLQAPAAAAKRYEIRTDQAAMGFIYEKLHQSRMVLQSANQVVHGVMRDWNRVLNIIRQAGLLAKDAAGVGITIGDLPSNLQASVNEVRSDVKDNISRTKDVFEEYTQIPLAQVRLEGKLLDAVNGEIRACRNQTRAELEERRDFLLDAAADLADAMGAGSEIYNKTYGRKSRISRRMAPTPNHVAVLSALLESAWQFDQMIALRPPPENRTPDSMEFVSRLAGEAGVEFVIPRSQFALPFPYGGSLEGLATQYLGSPDRWHEIATLNKLRAPYVDESGFDLPLSVNGSGDTVVVGSAKDLQVGQVCWLRSNTRSQERFVISGIHEIPGGWQVRLDGARDLERFRVDNDAVLHAHLPGTISAGQLIYIPLPDDAPADLLPRFVPNEKQQDALLRVGGVDLLLDQQGDLVLNEGGAVYCYGMGNIIQAIRIALSTVRGSLVRHPEFGVGIEPGQSVADFDASLLRQHIQGLFVDDPAILGVEGVRVRLEGGRVALEMEIRLNGIDQSMPIALQLTPSNLSRRDRLSISPAGI